MNLDELQSVRDRERQTDKLQQLRPSFYEDAGEFIQQLRAERDRAAAQADNPFDAPEVGRLTDEINTAEQIVEAIYENRIGKIVKAASLDAAGLAAEAEGLTTEEADLFETLVADIQDHRASVLDVLEREDGPHSDGQANTAPGDISAADVMGGDTTADGRGEDTATADDAPAATDPNRPESGDGADPDGTDTSPDGETTDASGPVAAVEPSESGTDSTDSSTTGTVREDGGTVAARPQYDGSTGETRTGTEPNGSAVGDAGAATPVSTGDESAERRRVVVTAAVEAFVGFDDRDYDLAAGDVVSLPAANADILLDKDLVRRLQ